MRRGGLTEGGRRANRAVMGAGRQGWRLHLGDEIFAPDFYGLSHDVHAIRLNRLELRFASISRDRSTRNSRSPRTVGSGAYSSLMGAAAMMPTSCIPVASFADFDSIEAAPHVACKSKLQVALVGRKDIPRKMAAFL